MLGFKRKNEEDTLALVPKKENIFEKIKAFFKKDKKEEESNVYYTTESFYAKHSDIAKAIDEKGEEVSYGTVSINGVDIYSFQKMKEIGLMPHKVGKETKLIIADLNQTDCNESLEAKNLRKICFEIPKYYSLDEFLYNDGLYELAKSGRLNLNLLNYYKVNPVGNVEINVDTAMNEKIEIKNNKEETIEYVDKKLTKDLLNRMQKTKKEQEKLKKAEDRQRVEAVYKQAIIDEERIAKRESQEQENRINDNNIRVAPGKNSMYFTDPDTGKIIYLENITKINTVCHSNHEDNSISNLYVAKYTVKRNHTDVQNLASNKNIAFELTEDEIKDILKNRDERLNLAFRMFFSEANTEQYINNEKLGDRHIGYLKDTEEGYRILLASSTCITHLNSLNLEQVNSFNQKLVHGENDEPR